MYLSLKGVQLLFLLYWKYVQWMLESYKKRHYKQIHKGGRLEEFITASSTKYNCRGKQLRIKAGGYK